MSRFIRRNRRGVLAATLVFAALAAGAIGTGIGLTKAVRSGRAELAQSRVAEAEARRAANEAQIAVALSDFVTDDLLGAVRPAKLGIEVTVREALDAAALRLDERFDDQPLVESAIRRTLGRSYVALGRYDLAEPHLERALEVRTALLPEDDPALIESMDDLGTLRSMNNLGALLRRQGRLEEAEVLYVFALETRRRTSGDADPSTLISMNNLATLYLDMRRPDDAAPLLEQLVVEQRRVLGPEHPDLLSAVQNLAALRTAQERHEDAESLLRELLDARRRALGLDHLDTLITMNALAASLVMLDRWDESLLLLDDALASARRALSVRDSHVGQLLHTRGRALTGLARHQDAEVVLLEAHRMLTTAFGPKHMRVRRCADALAELYDAWERPEDAAMWREGEPTPADTPEARRPEAATSGP